MSFTITITEQKYPAGTYATNMTATEAVQQVISGIEVFRQTVETLDLQAVFNAINRKKRVRRAPIKTKPE